MRNRRLENMPRDRREVSEEIARALEIPKEEAGLYVAALTEGKLVPRDEVEKRLAVSLSARGMLIQGAAGNSYLPVHPRLALSNLFRAYEEKLVRQRKEKRLLVDRLTLELIQLFPSESKGTNVGRTGGAATTTSER